MEFVIGNRTHAAPTYQGNSTSLHRCEQDMQTPKNLDCPLTVGLRYWRPTLSCIVVCVSCCTVAAGQETQPSAPSQAISASELPILAIPAGATEKQLEEIIKLAKQATPRSLTELTAVHTAIRDASKMLVQILKDPNSPRSQAAKLDELTSSVTLMTSSGPQGIEKARKDLVQYLNSRKELAIRDLQMGLLVATYLEMQPNKTPARETYNLMIDLLADDARDEMKSLRQNLLANVRRLDLLGNKLELKAKALDGTEISTDKFSGKFVIVDFFASWCDHCLGEVPRLRGHLEKYGPRGLTIVGISLDEDLDELKKYLQKSKLPWPVIHDGDSNPMATLRMKFGVATLPTVMLLNKEGAVISLEARGAELDRLMQRIFEQPTVAEPTPANADSPKKADSATTASPTKSKS